ncbi:MAG: tyrosine-type recombinase/integrase [Verrucomicrobiota bacterium]
MTLIKRRGVYHARFKTQHGTKTLSTKQRDKRAAAQAAKEAGVAEIEAAAQAGRLATEAMSRALTGRKVTLAAAIVHYGEWQGSIGRSARFIQEATYWLARWVRELKLENQPPGIITEKHISKFVNDPDSKLKLSSRKQVLSFITTFLDMCSAKGWVVGNPARLVRINFAVLSHEQKEAKTREPFNDLEISRILHNTEGFWHVATYLGRHHGYRLGDVCQLQWESFNQPGQIIVWTDKGDVRLVHKVDSKLIDEIAKIPITDPKYVFPKEREIILSPTLRPVLSTQFKRLCQKLGIKGKTFHNIRHTYATERKNEGAPLETIRGELGHASAHTTAGYIH